MKHFSYLSEDIYTYENLVELQRIIEFDGFGVSKIIEEDRCIQYSINREKCIRLSDLVYFISFKLVRIHLGQLLVLLKSLAEKVKQLQQENIEHYYLDCNRIWLKFNDSEQVFKIYYETQNYTIHFTGYQCPNYEDFDEQENLSMKSSQKILIIIKYIIDNCFDKVILQENKNIVKKTITDRLYYGIHNKNLDKLINEIDEILTNYQFDKNKQIISIDEYVESIKDQRYERKIDYINDIKKIMNNTIPEQMKSTKFQAYLIENYIYYYLPSIVQQIDSSKEYERVVIDDVKIQKAFEQFQQIQSDIQTKIQNYIEAQIIQAVEEQIQFYSQFYKFEFQQNEINNALKQVIYHHAIIKYFQNTYTYIIKYTFQPNIDNYDVYKPNIYKLLEAMKKAIQKIITVDTQQYMLQEIQIQILQLINEMI